MNWDKIKEESPEAFQAFCKHLNIDVRKDREILLFKSDMVIFTIDYVGGYEPLLVTEDKMLTHYILEFFAKYDDVWKGGFEFDVEDITSESWEGVVRQMFELLEVELNGS
jgi:hypothetical protein